jgi:hypothetical protein
MKKFTIRWPDLNIQVEAKMLDKNPELCAAFWDHLPFQTIQSHALVAGVEMYSWVPIVTTAQIRIEEPFDQQPIGTVNFYSFYGLLSIKYGPVSEPLPAPPIAEIRGQKDLEKLKIVGREAWDSIMHTKRLIRQVMEKGAQGYEKITS